VDHIAIQADDFSLQQEYDRLRASRPGAIVTFSGLVRDFNRNHDPAGEPVQALQLQHYPGMTEKLVAGMVAEARQRWALQGVIVIHRVGELQPGDQIVLVAVSAAHRAEAFAAAAFLMDYLKTRATLWKQVSIGGRREWVEAYDTDRLAAARWQEGAERERNGDS